MASTVEQLYKEFNAIVEGRFSYQNNKLNNTANGITLYAFSYLVSNFSRSLRVSPTVFPVKVIQTHSNYKAAFREKKDGGLFKKQCSLWNHCIFETKEEAAEARLKVSKYFIERITSEENKLCALRNSIEKNAK